MRRVMLLTLLALALPIAALANSTDPTFFNTGTFTSGTIATVNVSNGLTPGTFRVTLTGSSDIFIFNGTPLGGGCGAGAAGGTCMFASGTLIIENLAGTPIFNDGLTNGEVIMGATLGGSNSATISADLAPTSAIPCLRCELHIGGTWVGGATGNLTAGNGVVLGASVPEPGALGLLELGLLGNGVIGLVGMARRKLKIRT